MIGKAPIMILSDFPGVPRFSHGRITTGFAPSSGRLGKPARPSHGRNARRRLFGALRHHPIDGALGVAEELGQFSLRSKAYRPPSFGFILPVWGAGESCRNPPFRVDGVSVVALAKGEDLGRRLARLIGGAEDGGCPFSEPQAIIGVAGGGDDARRRADVGGGNLRAPFPARISFDPNRPDRSRFSRCLALEGWESSWKTVR